MRFLRDQPCARFVRRAILALVALAAVVRMPRPVAGEGFPRVPPTPPEKAVATFRVEHGFRMELLAAEPLTMDPVAMEYDENGRAYVVEMSDYPHVDPAADKPFTENVADPPLGRVRILEDVDGDGRFDESVIFADKLSWPTGVCCWKGGVFVAATPDLWYLKDTDGDRRADVRRKVFSGFRKFNVQGVMNNLHLGIDHFVVGAGASNGGAIRSGDRPDDPPITFSTSDFRFDPATEVFELESGGARFGNTFDDWGNRFICNIRNPAQHVVLSRRYLSRDPWLVASAAVVDVAQSGDALPVFRVSPPEPWRTARARRWALEKNQSFPRSETTGQGYVTSASGVTIYRGDAYPAEFRGSIFLGEVSGNLIHRQTLTPEGVSFVSRRAEEGIEFVASTDNWFRPVNFAAAPDGTLHVLDMYRETIEHPWSIPEDLLKQLDLRSGEDRGRIYRLAPADFQSRPPPRLGQASIEELVAALESDDGWRRDTAHRLLYERQDPRAVEPLQRLAHQSPSPLARLHALWSLAGLDRLAVEDLQAALGDTSPGVREHAIRLAEQAISRKKPDAKEALLPALVALSDDPEIRVRFQLALSLGEFDDPSLAPTLARIARRDAGDPLARMAILSSAAKISLDVAKASLVDCAFAEVDRVFVRELAALVAAESRQDDIDALVELVSTADASPQAIRARHEVLLGMAEGTARVGKPWAAALGPSARNRAWFEETLSAASRTVRSDDVPEDDLVSAIEILRLAEFVQTKDSLAARLDAQSPRAARLAAARTLSSFADPGVASVLLERFPESTPDIRGEMIEALLSRPERLGPLLAAVESGVVPASRIPNARRKLLLAHAEPFIREKAQELFSADLPGARQAAIDRYQAALALVGVAERGAIVFRRDCANCHRLRNEGHDIGPNLATIKHKGADEVLLNVLDPNREVAANFVEYVVELEDGRLATGVIDSESSASLTLRRAENIRETIPRRSIVKLASSGASLMPEGFEKKITIEEMADLLAYLFAATSNPLTP